MDAKEILKIITDEDIINIMSILGSAHPKPAKDGLLFQSICHNGPGEGKFKLHYYSESKTFYCYTHCGNLSNIFDLVMEVNDCSFREAYIFVCDVLGISINNAGLKVGFREITDNSFIKKFKKREIEKAEHLRIRDKNVINGFWDLYHITWINDYISTEVMKEFNIKFDISNNAIIIPHFNIDNELIGIRARYLNQDMIDEGKKYMPIYYDGELYNYPTGMSLFGLNINKENIKRYKKVIIGEAEKFVMQHKSYYPDSIAVAINGSSLSYYQIQLLKDLGVETVILALDKEFTNKEGAEEYALKIKKKFISKLYPYFRVEILWDNENLLEYKDSPADKGKEVFEKLWQERTVYESVMCE